MIALIILSGLVITGNFVCFHVCMRQEKKIRELYIRHIEEKSSNNMEINRLQRITAVQAKRNEGYRKIIYNQIQELSNEIKCLDSTVNILATSVLELQKKMESLESFISENKIIDIENRIGNCFSTLTSSATLQQ